MNLHIESSGLKKDVVANNQIAGIVDEKKMIRSEIIKSSEETQDKKSQATAMVEFVLNQMSLFHDDNAEVYAQSKKTQETFRLIDRQFKDWLVANFYQSTEKSPRDQSLNEALSTLAGLARHQGESKRVFTRVGQFNDAYYVDLAQPGNSVAVEIQAGQWKLIDNPPVNFLRSNTMVPLPKPAVGCELSSLWQLINVPENSHLLVITWLLDSLRPDTPFPVLELIGEQGCAKSTSQAFLRRLIDPNSANLRSMPKSVDDIFVTANLNWLVSYENISYLSSAMQDALCVLSTGGGFAKRKLYTDIDETVINVKRPIVINGISAAITAQDLVDRTLSIEVEAISQRQEKQLLEKQFKSAHPKLLGSLLTIFSEALAILPETILPKKNNTRLIEFVKLGMAVSQVMGHPPEKFLKQFQASRLESINRTIDASPVATALIEWLDQVDATFHRLPAKMLFAKISDYKPRNTDAWPKTAKGFADAMRRLSPALKQLGIICRCTGKQGSYVYWEVEMRN